MIENGCGLRLVSQDANSGETPRMDGGNVSPLAVCAKPAALASAEAADALYVEDGGPVV